MTFNLPWSPFELPAWLVLNDEERDHVNPTVDNILFHCVPSAKSLQINQRRHDRSHSGTYQRTINSVSPHPISFRRMANYCYYQRRRRGRLIRNSCKRHFWFELRISMCVMKLDVVCQVDVFRHKRYILRGVFYGSDRLAGP